jgi:zinc transport system ATP-binding protein
MPLSMPAPVEIRDGAVALGGRPILRGIDLTVSDGEVLAVLGSNGSGKSTLVRAALGLVPLARGEVRLFGLPLADFDRWQRIGYVPQRPAAASGVPATVREVVAAGRLARRRLMRPLGQADRAAIDLAIAAVDLGERQSDSVSTLSGGQQQRVLIARALAGEPDLFVLDEPTAGVDLASQLAFAEALTSLARRGATIVLVAHELGPMEPLIDRVVVVSDGRIVYDGAPQPSPGLLAFHDHAHPEPPVDNSPFSDRGWP